MTRASPSVAQEASSRRALALGPHLEALHARFAGTPLGEKSLARDPIQFARRYKDPVSAEVAGLLAACHAYGRVDLFLPHVARLLDALTPSPAEAVRSFRAAGSPSLSEYRYRFTTGRDVALLLAGMGRTLRRHGSLGAMFQTHFRGDPHEALSGFVEELLPPGRPSRGLRHLLPDPAARSACKRLHLFLRWMVRTEWPDLGIWSFLSPAHLTVPLDTHVYSLARALDLTRRRTPGLEAAREVTAALRQIAPKDPLRYDFVLCHLCISGDCRKRYEPGTCEACALFGPCRWAARPKNRPCHPGG